MAYYFQGDRDELSLESKRRFIMSETARAFASQFKFHEAMTQFEETEDDMESDDIGLMLLATECYIQLGKEIKAEKIIRKLKRTLQCHPLPNLELMDSLSGIYTSGISNTVKGLMLRKLSYEMYKMSDLSPNEKFSGIYKNIHESNTIVRAAIGQKKKKVTPNLASLFDLSSSDSSQVLAQESGNKLRLFAIAMDYGVEGMLEMYETLKEIPGVSSQTRAKDLASCANSLGFIYCLIDNNRKSIKWRKEGIQTMQQEYGDRASGYNLFGDLHHNMGVCLYNLHRFQEAEETYKKAIEIYEGATDYPDEAIRANDLRQSRSDLKDTREAKLLV